MGNPITSYVYIIIHGTLCRLSRPISYMLPLFRFYETIFYAKLVLNTKNPCQTLWPSPRSIKECSIYGIGLFLEQGDR